MSDRMTIIIRLPAPIDAVGEVLRVVTKHWPQSTIDLSGKEGWEITVPPQYDQVDDLADHEWSDSILHSVWLHGDTRAITEPLTTEQKEAFADAVERYSRHLDPDEFRPGVVDRWWR